MSYTMVVQHNIKLKSDTPRNVIRTLKQWHARPWGYDHLKRDYQIDVSSALGAGCGGRYGTLRARRIFNSGSGVVPHIRTTAMFNRGENGVDKLQGFFNLLAEYVDNTDEVIAVIRGEDDMYDRNGEHLSMFEVPEPRYGYYEVRVHKGRAIIDFVVNDIYTQLPWVDAAY